MPNPIANIHRLTEALGPDGQLQGLDVVLYREVPLHKFRTLGSTEPEVAGQQQAIAVHSFEIHADPGKPIRFADYLTIGTRRLNIQQIDDQEQNGQRLTLICGEEVLPR